MTTTRSTPCSLAPTLPAGPAGATGPCLHLAIQTGLRVSELVGLRCQDLQLGRGPHLRCTGKGRKERVVPLTTTTVAVIRDWLRERQGAPTDPLFPSIRGARLSRDAVEHLLAKHIAHAAETCPTLHGKKLAPHALRHTCAVQLHQAGVEASVIALWLGHETIRTVERTYLHADLAMKEAALARTAPRHTPPGRYRPADPLLTFLEGL